MPTSKELTVRPILQMLRLARDGVVLQAALIALCSFEQTVREGGQEIDGERPGRRGPAQNEERGGRDETAREEERQAIRARRLSQREIRRRSRPLSWTISGPARVDSSPRRLSSKRLR